APSSPSGAYTAASPSPAAPGHGPTASAPADPAPTGTAGPASTTVTPDHAPRPVAVPDAAPLVGIAYGYRGAPAYWWDRQVRTGLRDRGADPALLDDYFELTEIHVLPSAQGGGVGSRL